MFQKSFFDAWIFVPFLLISCFFTQIASYYGPILSAQMNSKAMAVSSICGIFVNITLNILLTLLIGPIGIAVATAISSFVIYFIRRRFVVKTVAVEEGLKVYFSWVLMVLLACGVTFGWNIILNLGLFAALIVICFRDIISIITTLINRIRKRG